MGDYGNVISDNNGNIITSFNDTISTLYGPFGVVFRTIVLHKLQDDLGLGGNSDSLLTGNSGQRIACGNFYLFIYLIIIYLYIIKINKGIIAIN